MNLKDTLDNMTNSKKIDKNLFDNNFIDNMTTIINYFYSKINHKTDNYNSENYYIYDIHNKVKSMREHNHQTAGNKTSKKRTKRTRTKRTKRRTRIKRIKSNKK
jgi:hypothetical protein